MLMRLLDVKYTPNSKKKHPAYWRIVYIGYISIKEERIRNHIR
jgi:hypothetical protein